MCAIWPLADGAHFAVNGRQMVFGRTLVECLDVRHLDSRSQVCFSRDLGASFERVLLPRECGRHVIADDILQFVR